MSNDYGLLLGAPWTGIEISLDCLVLNGRLLRSISHFCQSPRSSHYHQGVGQTRKQGTWSVCSFCQSSRSSHYHQGVHQTPSRDFGQPLIYVSLPVRAITTKVSIRLPSREPGGLLRQRRTEGRAVPRWSITNAELKGLLSLEDRGVRGSLFQARSRSE